MQKELWKGNEAIAEAALAQLPQMIYCVRASVALFDFETDEYWLLAVYTVQEETRIGKGWRAPLAYEWPAHIDELRRGEAVVINDVQELAEARISPLMNALQYEGIRALIRQPLRARGELIGTLDLGLPRPGPVASHLTDLARELADQLAIAIQQARLHRQVQDYAAQLERRVVWRIHDDLRRDPDTGRLATHLVPQHHLAIAQLHETPLVLVHFRRHWQILEAAQMPVVARDHSARDRKHQSRQNQPYIGQGEAAVLHYIFKKCFIFVQSVEILVEITDPGPPGCFNSFFPCFNHLE